MIVRKVDSISRWDSPKEVKRQDRTIPGDTLSELRTKENKLSVWLANTEEDIEDAVAALSLSRDGAKKLVMVVLNEQELAELDIEVVADQLGEAQGASASILQKHRNLVELDHKRLGMLAEYMIRQAKDQSNRKTYTEAKVKAILNRYKEESKIDVGSVKKNISEKLDWRKDGNA